MLRILLLVLAVPLALVAGEERVYFIGNSVTDTVNYGGFKAMGEARSVRVTWARHMIPGAPLDWLWSHQGEGFSDKPYGTSRPAVTDFAWDHITLQPFDRQIDGDRTVITEVVALQLAKNPDCRFWIYQRWPRMQDINGKSLQFDKDDYDPAKGRLAIDLARIKPWKELYNRPHTGGWDNSNESRDYFTKLLTAVRTAEPKAAFRLIPVGDVMAELDARLLAGQVAGWSTVWQVYKDGIHLGPTGSYLCGATFATTLLGLEPKDLPTQAYGAVDPLLVPVIQDCIVTVMSRTPDARR